MKYLTTILFALVATIASAQTGSISGSLFCAGGEAMTATTINISGTDGTNIDFLTLADGTFEVLGLPTGVDYTLTVAEPILNSSLNGVSTFDLVLMMKHILGTDPFDSAAQFIAADVNGSGTISTLDLVQTRMRILNITNGFPQGSWAFVNATCLDSIPPTNCGLTISNLQAAGATLDIIGIKIGDVNNTSACN